MNGRDNIRELQLLELNVLKEFAAVCDRHNLTYYLSEGTLLGAIRHQGFIPWDDDVDVCMPREDYDIFANIVYTELPEYMGMLYFRHSDKNKKDRSFFAHPYDKRYNILWKMECDKYSETLPIWIDVTPLDGLPKKSLLKTVHHIRMKILRATFRCSQVQQISTDRKLALSKRLAIILAGKMRLDKLNTNKCLEKYDDAAKRYPYKDSESVINYGSEYGAKTIVPKKWYGEGRMIRFEDTEFRIPTEAEKILSQEYGDYMTLPPESDRKPKHIYMIKKYAGGGYKLRTKIYVSTAFILQYTENVRKIA